MKSNYHNVFDTFVILQARPCCRSSISCGEAGEANSEISYSVVKVAYMAHEEDVLNAALNCSSLLFGCGSSETYIETRRAQSVVILATDELTTTEQHVRIRRRWADE